MKPPETPVPPMSRKTDQELLAILGSPSDSPPAVLDAAKIELWKRHAPDGRGSGKGTGRRPPPQLSSMAVYSLVLCLLPYIGLPLAISSLRRIAKSDGRLYGRRLAWASVIINVLCLLFWLGVVTLTLLMGMAGQ